MSNVVLPDPGEEAGRPLTTVMFTDMVGYSELTQRDEIGALRLVNEHRAIVRPLLAEHGGREVKTIGDAFMVEFADPSAAVRCALAIQRRHAERNRNPSVPEVTIRIGLHSGRVIRQEGDLFGDTVNIASRIEPLSPPGGICLSAPVYESAQAGLDVAAIPVGPATLKNIQLPVSVYRIDLRAAHRLPMREGAWVDREEELASLHAAFEAAASGHPRVVVIAGESGLGKTRLAEQLIQWAGRQEASVVWGRTTEEGAAPPYSLWTQAIEEAVQSFPPETLRDAAGEFAPELGRLVPSLRPPGPELLPEPEVDLDRARERLFLGVLRFFRELSRSRPMILFLDDLQWADAGSLRMFGSLADGVADCRLLLLALHRPEPPGTTTSVLAGVRAALAERGEAVLIALGNLSLPSVRQLVLAHVKTKAIPDDFVQQVFDRTGGNPYFVEQVIRSLRDSGLLSIEPGQPFPRLPENLPLPDSVRRLIRQRIEGADEGLVSFLRTVAVLGPEFGSEPLPRLSGLAPEALIDRLGAAVRAGLLLERSDTPGAPRYAFPERLVWETVYGDSPTARRVRDHLRAGEALESLRRGGLRISAAEIAYHFQRAQAPDRALEYTLQAAEEAGRLFAREDAVRQYRAALALLDQRPDDRMRARALEALGDHLYRLGQLEAGQSRRVEAVACYERLGDLGNAGRLHRKIAHAMREDPGSARFHWEEARRLLESVPESPELARLYATIAGFRYEEGDSPGARELYAHAVEVARRVVDPVTQVSGQIVLAGLQPVSESTRVLEELREALDLAERERLDDLVPNLYMVLALARIHVLGDGPGAEAALEGALSAARRARDIHSERTVEGNLVTYVAWRLGQYDRALRTVEAHLQYAAGDLRKLLPTALLVDADIALTRSDPERAASDLEEAASLLEGGGDWSERVHLRNVRGRSELLRGRLPKARDTLREAHQLAVRAGTPALMAVLHAETLHAEVDAAVRSGEPTYAEEVLATLERLDHEAGQPTIRAYFARARGILLGSAGDLRAAIAALEESEAIWIRIGWEGELADCRLQLAALYRRTGSGERAEALEGSARSYLGRFGAPAGRPEATPGGGHGTAA